jgi:fluoride exporter
VRDALWIAIAGALGALSRYGVSSLVNRHFGERLAWGTLTVNIAGSLLLGLLMQVGMSSEAIPKSLRMALTVGFLGAFTTFSTFSYETYRYVENGAWGTAAVNVVANVIPGLIAAAAGLALGRVIVGS